jgi:2-oxoglutarate dehydrogenase E1 component
VHASWAAYFNGLEHGVPSDKAFIPPPSAFRPVPLDGAPALHAGGGQELSDHLKVRLLTGCTHHRWLIMPHRSNCSFVLTK